jgi:hypothetical protein
MVAAFRKPDSKRHGCDWIAFRNGEKPDEYSLAAHGKTEKL